MQYIIAQVHTLQNWKVRRNPCLCSDPGSGRLWRWRRHVWTYVLWLCQALELWVKILLLRLWGTDGGRRRELFFFAWFAWFAAHVVFLLSIASDLLWGNHFIPDHIYSVVKQNGYKFHFSTNMSITFLSLVIDLSNFFWWFTNPRRIKKNSDCTYSMKWTFFMALKAKATPRHFQQNLKIHISLIFHYFWL